MKTPGDRLNISPDDSIKFITEAEHVHSSSEAYFDRFNKLKHHLGMDSEDLSGCC